MKKSKHFTSCIYITLQKAMRPIGQPPGSIVKSQTSSEACSLKLLKVGEWLSYLTLDWQFFVSQIQIWSWFFKRSIGWWVIGVFPAGRAVQNATLPEYSEITDFIWRMLTKTADSWRVVVLFDLRLTVFCIPNPNLVSLFEPVDRLVGCWRFPEAGQTLQNATLPEYSEITDLSDSDEQNSVKCKLL